MCLCQQVSRAPVLPRWATNTQRLFNRRRFVGILTSLLGSQQKTQKKQKEKKKKVRSIPLVTTETDAAGLTLQHDADFSWMLKDTFFLQSEALHGG